MKKMRGSTEKRVEIMRVGVKRRVGKSFGQIPSAHNCSCAAAVVVVYVTGSVGESKGEGAVSDNADVDNADADKSDEEDNAEEDKAEKDTLTAAGDGTGNIRKEADFPSIMPIRVSTRMGRQNLLME